MRRQLSAADLILVSATLFLLCIGVVMVLSASSYEAYKDYGDAFYWMKRQLIWVVIGISAMLFFMNFDYHHFRKVATPGLAVSLVLLVIVLFRGHSALGATRWIGFGAFSIQPSEITKVALAAFIAAFYAAKPERIRSWDGLLPVGVVLGLVVGLIMKQPDFGSALVILCITGAMLMAAGMRGSHMGTLAALTVPALFVLAKAKPYRAARLTAFLNPWAHRQDIGYQTIQSLIALGSGGLIGLGLGQSRQKYLYLPEQHTDFIFAILGEELGLLGTLTVVSLYFVFAWRGFKIAVEAPDHFGSLLAAGLTAAVVFQALLNMLVISGSLPITGVTLPLISYGGSSLAITLSCVGILLNISKQRMAR